MELPRVDEHAVDVDADRERVWLALDAMLPRALDGPGVTRFAGVLGCRERHTLGSATSAGSTLPGFRVERAEHPSELALEGQHRFSRYALLFHLDDLGSSRSRLRAETRAAFPGKRGALYRALVIGTRGHVLAVRRILRAIKRHAEHEARATPDQLQGRP